MVCAQLFAHAQTITILDKETNEPIEQVSLISDSSTIYATTNAQGQADITAFKGQSHIYISIVGYRMELKSYAELRADSFLLKMAPYNLNLQGIVVSATGWRQSTTTVPTKISSISPQEIAFQNPQTAADLLNLSGKVFVQKSQQGGGSPMIRGFATNRLLYTVDGVRMNTAIFRGGNIQNVINLDPFTVENAEVLFGPGSVIYGSDAIGGVMSFQTIKPQFSLSDETLITGKAVTRFSSANNERTAHVDFNVGWGKWAIATSISSWDYDHLRQGSNGPEDYIKPYYVQRIDSVDRTVTQDDPLLQIPSAYSQMNIMQKVRYKPNKNIDIQYGFHYSETSPYGRYDRHNRTRNGAPRYAEWNYGPQVWMMNHLNINLSKPTILYDQLTLSIARQDFEESRIDRSLNGNKRSIQTEEVDAYSGNLDLIKYLGEKHRLFYGIEMVQNKVNSSGIEEDISTGSEQIISSRYPNSTWQTSSIYINDQYKITPKLNLQGGLRYSIYTINSSFDTSLNPLPFEEANLQKGALTGSFGFVYRPTETWVISINAGTAFRAPNVDDIGKIFDSEQGAVTVPNPNLEAEYAYNLDLGIAKVIAEHIKVDVAGYYTLLNNAMVRRNYTLNGNDSIIYRQTLSQVQAIQNAAQARVYGLQAGLEISLGGGFTLSSDLNIQIGEEELDDGSTSTSRHAAPMFGVSRLTYKAKRLSMQIYSFYQAERSFENMPIEERGKAEIYASDNQGNVYSPSWYTLNFKAMYQITHHFSLSAGMENITDQRYRPYSSGISGAGRNFVISVRANF
ncbi:TonB-dependent receptor [bacterium]|nr:TonB-dependent receptor [bacterium]